MKDKDRLIKIFKEILEEKEWRDDSLQRILRRNSKKDGKMYRKDELVKSYNMYCEKSDVIESRIRLKPVRTNSGVVTVTVLTKPFPCPGGCIFCPNDPNMPKSYISSEPGAQRALMNLFDPYAQVFNRLVALKNIGHNIQKVELIVLGGTWSYHDEEYKLSFVYECFRALNDVGVDTYDYVQARSDSLPDVSLEDIKSVQVENESAYCKNVGLVFETRPDYVTEDEVRFLRRLGCTKVQIGIQSLSDRLLRLNNVGRKNRDTREAFRLLRLGGFKIHGHWMPNLYGSSPRRDVNEYRKLWGRDYCPDELKIYPTSIIAGTRLYRLFIEGKYKPYSDRELSFVLKKVLVNTPRYCRLSRVVRDIPSNEIVEGNKKTNLRQIVENEIIKEGGELNDIRSREIGERVVSWDDLELEVIKYVTSVSNEFFISYRTSVDDRICGFLRLSIPKVLLSRSHFMKELRGCSVIREVHVYGKVVGIERDSKGESQHLGLGKSLISIAEEISLNEGFRKIAVISAIGTREYYRKRGFELEGLYMTKLLSGKRNL